MKKLFNKFRSASIVGFMLIFVSIPAHATIVQKVSGYSITGTAVIFEAQLTIAGDILTITLSNLSSVSSDSPDDLLSSYYFDIVKDDGSRPTLSYLSATGDVYLTNKSSLDLLQTSDADIKAVDSKDYTWEYKSMDATASPSFGFGIGTVGNSDLSSNNFNGNIVGGIDYSIYAGEITTRNLDNKLLVKSSATFTFSGLTGFTEADIALSFAFGMGTAPDSFLTGIIEQPNIPEPATIAMLCLGAVMLKKRK